MAQKQSSPMSNLSRWVEVILVFNRLLHVFFHLSHIFSKKTELKEWCVPCARFCFVSILSSPLVQCQFAVSPVGSPCCEFMLSASCCEFMLSASDILGTASAVLLCRVHRAVGSAGAAGQWVVTAEGTGLCACLSSSWVRFSLPSSMSCYLFMFSVLSESR